MLFCCEIKYNNMFQWPVVISIVWEYNNNYEIRKIQRKEMAKEKGCNDHTR